MLTRIRKAALLALAAALITSITAFAKGGFSFISIKGGGLKEEIRSEDPALTEDFFGFADFYQHKTSAPVDPGTGYEITRYYIEGVGEIAFDRLHYYPEMGFVYYDGIVNGSSEYDGEWYIAKSEIRSAFEKALSVGSVSQTQSNASTSSTLQKQTSMSVSPIYFYVVVILGLTVISLFTYRLRKPLSH